MADNINPAKTNEFAPRKKGCKVLLSTFYVLSRDRTLKTAYRKVSKGIGSNPTNSPSGDGNPQKCGPYSIGGTGMGPTLPIPRQGTETMFIKRPRTEITLVSNPTNSPSGDGNNTFGSWLSP